uniref:Tumor rejection antigen P1A n=1 Tax=Rattus norvegicus TaxID=10116 RepID=D3ZMB1_RAT|eukprot:XP_008771689.1 PREDICTED: tumor rejection antigen P815A-like isoform X1 [Rattus norvegicus]
MSDNNKPDKAHNGSGGEGDGNRSNLFDRHSLEEVMPYLEWLILIVATTGFLAFQLIVDAIYEEQYERDVAWIARQSKCRSPLDEDEDDEDGDDDDFYDDDDDEELENLMDDESEDEMGMEMSAGATCVFDLGTCTGFPDSHLRKNEMKCKVIYFLQHPNFLMSIPVHSKATMCCGCENADEEVAMEEEEEEEEEDDDDDDDDEIENLDGDPKNNLDFADGP